MRPVDVRPLVLFSLGLSLALGCQGTEAPQGIWMSSSTGGPVVTFDLFARPLPEVPLPNDIATRPDPSSPTGRRINASMLAPTALEQGVRGHLDRLDGWGTYSALTVSFEPLDRRLDVANILRRHADDHFDFTNDAIYLVNIDSDSPNFGQVRPLDLGEGNFPINLERRDRYYDNDPRGHTSNTTLETVYEDTNNNGRLDLCEDRNHNGVTDPGEDLDGDGAAFTAEPDLDGDGLLDPEEDRNGNGRRDCSEDTDFDGVLDVPNLFCGLESGGAPVPPWQCPDVVVPTPQGEVVRSADDHWLMPFYERETNSLLIRPVIPLDEQTEYAVVLTDRLVDEDGRAVESPFPAAHHVDQTTSIARLEQVLSDAELSEPFGGLEVEDIQFAWSFTTQSTTGEMRDLREGLYGRGPRAELAEQFPPELRLDPLYGCPVPGCELPDNRYVVPMNTEGGQTGFRDVLRPFAEAAFGLDAEDYAPLANTFDYVDYIVGVRFDSPNFLDNDGQSEDVDGDGRLDLEDEDINGNGELDPGEDLDFDGHLDVAEDLNGDGVLTGEEGVFDLEAAPEDHGRHEVTAIISIPRADPARGIEPPYPVVLYGHGYGSSRIEAFGFAGSLAKFGFATIGVDAVHHGNGIDEDLEMMVRVATDIHNMTGLADHLINDRARDLNGDGTPDSGGDFWSAYVFQTRDYVRQSGLDFMRLIQILRSFDGESMSGYDFDGDGSEDVAGDFNGDGMVDIGGDEADFYAMGASLGGILSAFLSGLEPAVVAAAPISGGGGLGDVGVRSTQGGVREAVILRTMGPLLMTGPASERYELQSCGAAEDCRGECIDGVCRCDEERDCRSGFICSEARADMASPQDICARSRDTSCGMNQRSTYFIVPDLNNTARVEYGCLDPGELAGGDTLVARNLNNGEVGCFVAWPGGRSRIHLPSDLLDPIEISIYDGEVLIAPESCEVRPDAEPHLVLDEFSQETAFQFWQWAAGDPLVSPAEGFGLRRATPEFRRFLGIAQIALEPGDPANMARHYFEDPVEYGSETSPANVMVVATVGDMNVPINTGVAIARAAGILDVFTPDPRLADETHPDGRTANRVLLDTETILGLEHMSVYRRPSDGRQVLFDVDDFDRSGSPPEPGWTGDGQQAPSLEVPLRVWRRRADGDSCTCIDSSGEHECSWPGDTVGPLEMVRCEQGVSALALPYIEVSGTHGFAVPEPHLPFDVHTYSINLIGYYFSTGGTEIRYDLCLADNSCTEEEQGFLIPPVPMSSDDE